MKKKCGWSSLQIMAKSFSSRWYFTSVSILFILLQNIKKTYSRIRFNKINNCIPAARRFLINKTGVIVFITSAHQWTTPWLLLQFGATALTYADTSKFTHYWFSTLSATGANVNRVEKANNIVRKFVNIILILQIWKGLGITGIHRS